MIYVMPKLETERLILNEGTYDDYVKVYEYDFDRLRDIAGEFEYKKCEPEQVRKTFESCKEENTLNFIVYLKDKKIPIGNIVFNRYCELLKSLEISINLHPNYWGNKYMKEALLCSMKYIYNNLDIDKIFYTYAIDNRKSLSLCKKIGFEYCGTSNIYFQRLNKEIIHIENIMTKEKFNELYNTKKESK